MEFWNNIIHTAMIGTDRKTIGADEVMEAIQQPAATVLSNTSIDKEEQFLQLASLAFNFRQSGFIPVKKENVTIEEAAAEEKPYCSAASMQVLKDILAEESYPLLEYWMKLCEEKQQLVYPEYVPQLFDIAVKQKKLQPYIITCTGKRGEWLCTLNKDWKFSAVDSAEEQWLTGTPEQRKFVLNELRQANPSIALEWVQKAWPQEDAQTKVVLLELLQNNINEQDISFLESLQTEKSKKVKEAAVDLLKAIPGSAIVKSYANLLEQSVNIKKEKALLGMLTKTSLQLKLPELIDEAIFKSGIEKLSSNKEITDEEHIIYQLIQSVPMVFWEKQFQLVPQEIIELFQKDAVGKKMLPAFVLSIKRFNDRNWAQAMVEYCSTTYVDLIPLLETNKQILYTEKFFKDYPDDMIHYASSFQQEWSVDFTIKVLQHAGKNPYQYTKEFFSRVIHLIPAGVQTTVQGIIGNTDYTANYWSATKDAVTKYIHLKALTNQSFTTK